MAPFGPLYFLEKHRRQPALACYEALAQSKNIAGSPPLPATKHWPRRAGAFVDRSKAQRSEP
jgi:hypothetical protein